MHRAERSVINFWCPVCNKEFCSPSRFQRHAAKLHKDQKLELLTEEEYRSRVSESKKICPTCNKIFQSDDTCKRHVKTVHRQVQTEEKKEMKTNETPLLYVRVWDDSSFKKCEIIVPTSHIH